MTDLNPLFNSFLKAHDTQLKFSRRKRSDVTDEFLKEAYRIVGLTTPPSPLSNKPPPPPKKTPPLKDNIFPPSSGYLQNAHISSLHTYLLRIRQPYLSISPSSASTSFSSSSHRLSSSSQHLTNPQRDRIDQESKSLLRDLQFSIQQLAAATALRHDTQLQLVQRKYGAGGGGAAFLLQRWANGGRNPVDGSGGGGNEEEKLRTEKTWRESVVWYLGRALEAAGEVHRGMMERRLEREVERSRSVLYMSRASGAGARPGSSGGGGGGSARKSGGEEAGSGPLNTSRSPTNINVNPPTANQTWTPNPTTTTSTFPPPSSPSSLTIEPDLDPLQLQLFAKENQDMLKQYEDTLDQVRYVSFLPFPPPFFSSSSSFLLGHPPPPLTNDSSSSDDNNTEPPNPPSSKSPPYKPSSPNP